MTYSGRKARVRLVGEDGNIFAIIGRVRKAMREQGLAGNIQPFTDCVQAARSYDEALRIVLLYADDDQDDEDEIEDFDDEDEAEFESFIQDEDDDEE